MTSKNPSQKKHATKLYNSENILGSVRNWLKITAASFVALVYVAFISTYTLGSIYSYARRSEPVVIGMSFSANQARNFGNDPAENLRWLVEKQGIKDYRMMSYWSDVEKTEGQFDFSDLKWQLDYLSTVPRSSVTLAIGMRQPRWPECHVPGWVTDSGWYDGNPQGGRTDSALSPLSGSNKLNDVRLESKLETFLGETIKFSSAYPLITSYQLENESANEGFAKCYGFNQARLKGEYELVKRLDPNRPVYISASNQHGLPLLGQIGDKVGFSVYRIAHLRPGIVDVKFIPPQVHGAKAALIKLIFNKESFIHELQTEPWGPKDTKDLSLAEQDKLMSQQDIADNISYAKNTGMKDIYLWGGEWWYWREINGNPVAK